MDATVIDFVGYAEAVGYQLREPPEDAGYLPAIGEHVIVHNPDGHRLGIAQVLMHDPTGPYVAVKLNGYVASVHIADIKPATWQGECA